MTTTDPRAWLAEVQERASKATPGPWKSSQMHGRYRIIEDRGSRLSNEVADDVPRTVDRRFIEHARTDNPAMAAALTAVLDLCDRLDSESAQGSRYADRFLTAITDALGGERG